MLRRIKQTLRTKVITLLIGALPTLVSAQATEPDATEAAARIALSVLSVAATPNETLSSFSVLSASGDASSFRSTQLRGGANPFDDPIYIEGLVAFQRYSPTFVFPDFGPGTELDVTWTSVAGTAGVGWDFALDDVWTLRPVGHVSLGHVTADALLANFPPSPSAFSAVDAIDGNLNSFGAGASIALFREAVVGDWRSEYRIRQTYMQFYPIDEPQAGNATASSNQTTLFSRHRYPLREFRPFNQASNLVLDAGVVLYRGDGSDVLRTDWIATAGVGLEVETEEVGLPTEVAGRVMLTGVVSEEFEGLSLGFAFSF